MNKCYFEHRKVARQSSVGLTADMMRHFHTRQYLGKSIVVCEYPTIQLAAAYKQWLRLSRDVQGMRINTLDADKILRYTHLITHMQHLQFSTKTPQEDPSGDIHFLRLDQLQTVPMRCYSTYLTVGLEHARLSGLLKQLPGEALVVDYGATIPAQAWRELGCQPKRALEAHAAEAWKNAEQFLSRHDINITELFEGSLYAIDAMDNALDALLAQSNSFLQVANNFCRALELARPLRVRQSMRRQYDTLTLLAYRVQALSGEAFTKRFLEMYNEDDSFFLYDSGRQRVRHGTLAGLPTNEGLAEAVVRHIAAGRHRLAEALGMFALVS